MSVDLNPLFGNSKLYRDLFPEKSDDIENLE